MPQTIKVAQESSLTITVVLMGDGADAGPPSIEVLNESKNINYSVNSGSARIPRSELDDGDIYNIAITPVKVTPDLRAIITFTQCDAVAPWPEPDDIRVKFPSPVLRRNIKVQLSLVHVMGANCE